VEVDWDVVQGLEPGPLQTALLDLVQGVMSGRSEDDEARAAASLPEPLLTIWILSWLDFEVTQGSLIAYFYNSHGRFAPATAEALERIGAQRMSAVLRRAITTHAAVRDTWFERRGALSAPGDVVLGPYEDLPGLEELGELTNEYWTAAEADEWGEKLDRYLVRSVREHAARHS